MQHKTRVSSDQRREQILDAACELFAQYGFGGTTTRQLAEKVGCSETIVFRIFPSKDAIFQQLFDEWSRADIDSETLTVLDDSALKTLEQFYIKMLNYNKPFEAGRLVRRGWRRDDLGDAIVSRIGEERWRQAYEAVLQKSNDIVRVTLAPVIRFGQQNGEIRQGDPELLAELFWCMISGIKRVKHSYPERFIDVKFADFAQMLMPVSDN